MSLFIGSYPIGRFLSVAKVWGEEMKGGRNRKKIKTEEMAKVVAAFWGTELIQFLASLAIFHQDDFKKRMNRIRVTWWNGGFEKISDCLVNIVPSHPPT